jgi:hypothetical protein
VRAAQLCDTTPDQAQHAFGVGEPHPRRSAATGPCGPRPICSCYDTQEEGSHEMADFCSAHDRSRTRRTDSGPSQPARGHSISHRRRERLIRNVALASAVADRPCQASCGDGIGTSVGVTLRKCECVRPGSGSHGSGARRHFHDGIEPWI